MDDYLLGLLWTAIVSGGFALLALVAEGAERFAEALDAWIESICSHYADD